MINEMCTLVEPMLENLSVSVKSRILKALKFLGGKLRPYSTAVLSYDLIALGFCGFHLPAWRYRVCHFCVECMQKKNAKSVVAKGICTVQSKVLWDKVRFIFFKSEGV